MFFSARILSNGSYSILTAARFRYFSTKQGMEKIVAAQLKLQEAQHSLTQLRDEEATRLSKAGSYVTQLENHNKDLLKKVQDLESKLEKYQQSKEKALLLSGESSLNLFPDDLSPESFKNAKTIKRNEVPDLLAPLDVQARDADDFTRSGFFLQMSSEYMTEKNDYVSGHVTLAQTARSRVRLKWAKKPHLVQIVKRPGDGVLNEMFWKVTEFLKKENIYILIDNNIVKDLGEGQSSRFLKHFGYTVEDSKLAFEPVDFIVLLGGDGTMIYTSNMHQKGIPPIVAFGLGSLGFLTPFKPNQCDVEGVLEKIIHNPSQFQCSVRSRANVSVYSLNAKREFELTASRRVLNEVVIDRGPTSTVVDLEISINNKHIGTVQGDGIIVSTPTGSTAYSVVAGGSLIHPALSALAVTPICCNPLSFRPFVVSDTQIIKIGVPENARNSAFVSFDGTRRVEIKQGEYMEAKFSKYPLLWFCANTDNEDWLEAIEHSFRISAKRERKQFRPSMNYSFPGTNSL